MYSRNIKYLNTDQYITKQHRETAVCHHRKTNDYAS